MDLDRDDFLGLFGVVGLTGILFVMMGAALGVYAYVGIAEQRTVLGQIMRTFSPDAAAMYRDLVIMLILGVILSVFGGFLIVVDYVGED